MAAVLLSRSVTVRFMQVGLSNLQSVVVASVLSGILANLIAIVSHYAPLFVQSAKERGTGGCCKRLAAEGLSGLPESDTDPFIYRLKADVHLLNHSISQATTCIGLGMQFSPNRNFVVHTPNGHW